MNEQNIIQNNKFGVYIELLNNSRQLILQEMESLLQKMKDPLSKEVLTKMKNLILLDHALNSITLADLMIKTYENQLEIDEELLAISDSVSQMLEIHLSEADNLRKLR
jgi:hypothetical protein